MTSQPAAYLRRSYVDPDSPGDISREVQLAAVRRLAHADGHNGDLVIYDDFGRSADHEKSERRTEYTRLLADMEAGKVSHLYAFDVDRLYRDPRDLIRLQDAAQAHHVRITTTGGPLAVGDGDDPAAEAFAFIGSVFGRLELGKAKKRAKAAVMARKARGDRMGHPTFGFRHVKAENDRIVRIPDESKAATLAIIRETFARVGTILGTARALNAAGVPSPKGGSWGVSETTRVVEAHWPELVPTRGSSGKRIKAVALFQQLLICPSCDATLTPNRVRAQYYCHLGRLKPGHGRYSISESRLLGAIQAEAGLLRAPTSVNMPTDGGERRTALLERRGRIVDSYVDGLLTRDQRNARLRDVDDALLALPALESLVALPEAVDWSKPAAQVNGVLRAMFARIELGPDLLPVRYVWRLPAWRSGHVQEGQN